MAGSKFIPWVIRAVLVGGVCVQAGVGMACPAKVVSLVVPYPAGGSMDAVMRLVAEAAAQQAGKTFVVRNIGGASGSVAVQHVLRQPADGCTVLAGNVNAVVLAPLQIPQAGYLPAELAPIAQVGSSDFVVLAAAGFPADRLEDLPRAAKARGRPLAAGHPGTETLQHMALPMIERQLQLRLLRVPYKGSALMVNDLIGGHIDMVVVAEPVAAGLLPKGQVKMLARLGEWLPSEAGGGQPALEGWAGWFVAAGTPAPAQHALRSTLLAALARPALQQQLAALGSPVPSAQRQQAFARIVAQDTVRYQQRSTPQLTPR